MTTKKKSAKDRSTQVPQPGNLSAYQRLDELLHTMRCIAQYEDRLCELSHELKRGGSLSPAISDEVRNILDKVPSHDYVLDLDAVRSVLVETTPSPRSGTKKSVARKSVVGKSAANAGPSRKKSSVAKKRSARKIGGKLSR